MRVYGITVALQSNDYRSGRLSENRVDERVGARRKNAARPDHLQMPKVQIDQTGTRPSLFRLWSMRDENGPSLPLGQQLRGRIKSKIFRALLFLHHVDEWLCAVYGGAEDDSLCGRSVEGLYIHGATHRRRHHAHSLLRSAALFAFHGNNVLHADAFDIRRRDRY